MELHDGPRRFVSLRAGAEESGEFAAEDAGEFGLDDDGALQGSAAAGAGDAVADRQVAAGIAVDAEPAAFREGKLEFADVLTFEGGELGEDVGRGVDEEAVVVDEEAAAGAVGLGLQAPFGGASGGGFAMQVQEILVVADTHGRDGGAGSGTCVGREGSGHWQGRATIWATWSIEGVVALGLTESDKMLLFRSSRLDVRTESRLPVAGFTAFVSDSDDQN